MPKRRPACPRQTEKERMYRAAFNEAEERGLSLAHLAVELDISAGTLSWWKSEIRRRDALRRGIKVKGKNSRTEESIEFVPVEVLPDVEPTPAVSTRAAPGVFEVALPGGATVRVPEAFEPAALTRLIVAVNAAC
jgi:hypothetical protein